MRLSSVKRPSNSSEPVDLWPVSVAPSVAPLVATHGSNPHKPEGIPRRFREAARLSQCQPPTCSPKSSVFLPRSVPDLRSN
jgi:hypothetical protein